MSVTLTTAPEQISFSQNEIPVQITSNNFIATPGVKSIVKIIFKTTVPNGQVIALAWSNANLTLTAAGTPNGTGKQYPSGSGNAAYVQSLIPVLEANFNIDSDFELSYELTGGFPSIVMTSREKGASTNITPVTGSVVEVSLATTGVNQQLQTSFAIHLQFWLKSGNVFKKILQNNLELDNPITGVTSKDIAEILHPHLVPGFFNNDGSDRPLLTAITWQLCTNTLLEYYLKFGEYFGDTPEVQKLITSPRYFVNIGSLDTTNALNQTLAGYLRQGANNKTLCLRQGSRTKKVQLEQPEFLYWINLTGSDIAIRLRIDIYYTDGDQSDFKVSPITALSWQKYYIGVGYNALNINAALRGGKPCAYYTASVINAAGDRISAIYTYQIEDYREWPRYFIYRNSLGGFQTVYTWGKGQPETAFTKEVVKKQVSQAKAAVSGSQLETNIRLQTNTSVNTGYTTARDIKNLKDFFASEEKYLVENGRYIPVEITSDNLKETMDGENLHAAEFTYATLYDDSVYTDDVTAQDNPNTSGGSAGGPTVYNVIIDNGKLDNVYIPEQ